MHDDSKRNKVVRRFAALLFLNAPAYGQQPGAPAPVPANPPSAAQPGSPTQGNPASNMQPAPGNPTSTATTLDYLYNRKPGDGTAAQGGGKDAGFLHQKAMSADMLSGAENLIPPLL